MSLFTTVKLYARTLFSRMRFAVIIMFLSTKWVLMSLLGRVGNSSILDSLWPDGITAVSHIRAVLCWAMSIIVWWTLVLLSGSASPRSVACLDSVPSWSAVRMIIDATCLTRSL